MRRWIHSTGDYPKEYWTWRAMRRRCTDPTHEKYPDYGGRGITVCARWLNDFDAFVDDMGRKPPGLTIERVDNDQGYDPFNCVWATYIEQAANTRRAIAAKQRNIIDPPRENWEILATRAFKKNSRPVKIPGIGDVLTHGSKRMYHKHKCRCDICVAGFRRRMKQKPSYSSPEKLRKKALWLKEYRRRKRNGQ